LVRSESRVSAERISTNPSGSYLLAEGRVEATLLPASSATAHPEPIGLFRRTEAVHFVADRLEGNPTRQQLEFTGDVRAWQGESNLKAQRVQLDRSGDQLVATGEVNTRIPRLPSGAISESDFVQIAADRLDYRGAGRLATYQGRVRLRQAEGWMEAADLVVELEQNGDGVRAMRASGSIRFEFRAPDREGVPQPVTGIGDRVHYTPADGVLTLFGDESPAAVRRTGEGGGTTSGRVLRYHLDSGALEVESGGRDRAKVRTSDG
jgi:lipopolysaccharide transport protein LptA